MVPETNCRVPISLNLRRCCRSLNSRGGGGAGGGEAGADQHGVGGGAGGLLGDARQVRV